MPILDIIFDSLSAYLEQTQSTPLYPHPSAVIYLAGMLTLERAI